MNLIVFISEFWEYHSVVSEVVYQVKEGLSISIEEDFLINLLEFVHTIEHLLKIGAWAQSENISLSHQVMGTTNIKSDDLRIKLYNFFDICNL
jgi:hypothetical protein